MELYKEISTGRILRKEGPIQNSIKPKYIFRAIEEEYSIVLTEEEIKEKLNYDKIL